MDFEEFLAQHCAADWIHLWEDDPADLAALDAGDVPDADAVRQCYQTDARFRVENPILSYVNGQMLPVELPPAQE